MICTWRLMLMKHFYVINVLHRTHSLLDKKILYATCNLHTDTLVLLFIPARCKLLMFRSWFRKHALAFPTYLFPAILTVFLSHPASFILRFDLFCWDESCWLLRKTHDCLMLPPKAFRGKPMLCQFGYTLWSLESSPGSQTTSIDVEEYPFYDFVLCHLMVALRGQLKYLNLWFANGTELTVAKNDQF